VRSAWIITGGVLGILGVVYGIFLLAIREPMTAALGSLLAGTGALLSTASLYVNARSKGRGRK
jgi:hypothetical protein